jgi:hypothetical protein
MSGNVRALSSHEAIIALSSLSTEAFVHMYYDNVDNLNHKSLDSLVHLLEDSGFNQFAEIIHHQQPYVVFSNPQDALKVYEFVNDHSAAVNANLIYKGHQNKEAEQEVKKDFPKVKEESQISHRYKK